MVPKLKISLAEIIDLQQFKDARDGTLFIGEVQRQIPFEIKRFYVISRFFPGKSIRGYHAHKKCNQIIFCINGSFRLNLDDGNRKQSMRLNAPSKGVWMKPMLWHTMQEFSSDCVLLVVASMKFKERDYIRNYQEFLTLLK